MKGYLYKDIVLSAAALGAMAVFSVIFTVIYIIVGCADSDPENRAALMAVCAFSAFYIANVFNTEVFRADEGRTYCSFAVSAPMSVKGQVMSKYIYMILYNLSIMILFFIADELAIFIKGDSSVSCMIAVFLFFCFELFSRAVEIPFLIRFGSSKGGYVKAAAVEIAMMAAGIYLLYGDISIFGDDPAKAVFELLQGPAAIWCIALFPWLSGILYYISYKLSLKLYRKGVISYE